jgi:hypothetical protein
MFNCRVFVWVNIDVNQFNSCVYVYSMWVNIDLVQFNSCAYVYVVWLNMDMVQYIYIYIPRVYAYLYMNSCVDV